jgi:hypothetical protein
MAKVIYGKPSISVRGGLAELYSWSPGSNDKTSKKTGVANGPSGVGCSLNEDYNVSYVYELLFTDGADKRMSYVVCDYVE